jgi:hypothetical protein
MDKLVCTSNNSHLKTFELLGKLETCVNDIIDDRPSEAALFVQQLIAIVLKKGD